jgi:hypothetical protein
MCVRTAFLLFVVDTMLMLLSADCLLSFHPSAPCKTHTPHTQLQARKTSAVRGRRMLLLVVAV